MTCAPYKYDKDLNQEYDMGIAGMGQPNGLNSICSLRWAISSGTNTGVNNVRMRFADVLLMYAEAVNELYGPREDAQEALKRVRRRAFASSPMQRKWILMWHRLPMNRISSRPL